MDNEYKNTRFTVILPVIISLSVITGIIIAEVFNKSDTNHSILISPKKDKLNMVIDYVDNEYVDEVTRQQLVEMAIPKFLESLDPHTVYFTAEEAKGLEEELEGNFEGIGIQFNIFKDTVLVVAVIEDGPSEKSGLKSGDRIIYVNDTLIAGVKITNEIVMQKLKGQEGSIVTLKVYRRGFKNLLTVRIKRGQIPLKSVDAYYKITDSIGYIKITSFSKNTHTQFIDAIFTMKQSGMKTVILDLRNNAGGYLNSATDITDEFLENGKMIVFTEGRARGKKVVNATTKRSACIDLDVVVLIDEFSASAAEIVSGAIQDNDRGFVVGRRSYGKGLVQESTVFDDGSIIRLTTARYYTPSGRCIQKSYVNGQDEYNADIYNRYLRGEFLEKDSIVLNDSLIFKTSKGRLVYGGGGIMPDVFVPIDTAGYSLLYSDISRKSLDYTFSIEYVDKNREMLQDVTSTAELISLLKSNNVMQAFWSYVKSNGITIRQSDIYISGKYIENNVYAYIARQILGDSSFYEISNTIDPVLDTALNIIKSGRKLKFN
ncbi:MAG TPA: S41 family peptidase [Bacteroidales bacterium]|nr:S41 family peptidase [Bacteroidales bacterium]